MILTIKTNKVKTWDINYPRRYCFTLKREVIPFNPPTETPIILDNKRDFIIKLKK